MAAANKEDSHNEAKRQNPLPRIAENQDAFTDALFQPGGTFDGYIDRVLKNGGIKLFFRGETYVLNKHHVFCLATKLPNGKTWYSYGGKLNELSLCALADLETEIRNLLK